MHFDITQPAAIVIIDVLEVYSNIQIQNNNAYLTPNTLGILYKYQSFIMDDHSLVPWSKDGFTAAPSFGSGTSLGMEKGECVVESFEAQS